MLHKKLEQYSRRANIRLYGIPETERENTDKLMLDLLRDKMALSLSLGDIDRSHRIGFFGYYIFCYWIIIFHSEYKSKNMLHKY